MSTLPESMPGKPPDPIKDMGKKATYHLNEIDKKYAGKVANEVYETMPKMATRATAESGPLKARNFMEQKIAPNKIAIIKPFLMILLFSFFI